MSPRHAVMPQAAAPHSGRLDLEAYFDHANRRAAAAVVKQRGTLLCWNRRYADVMNLGPSQWPAPEGKVLTPVQLDLARYTDRRALEEKLLVDVSATARGWAWSVFVAYPQETLTIETWPSSLAEQALATLLEQTYPWLAVPIVHTVLVGVAQGQLSPTGVVNLSQLIDGSSRRTVQRRLAAAKNAGAIEMTRARRGLRITLSHEVEQRRLGYFKGLFAGRARGAGWLGKR